MEIGVFIPIGNNGWLISSTSPQYTPSFDLNREVVLRAERYGFDLGGAGQRREHDLGRRADLARAVRPRGARGQVRRRRLAAHVVDDQLVAALLDIGGHAGPHDAETDEPDFHDCPPKTPLAMRAAVMAVGQPE